MSVHQGAEVRLRKGHCCWSVERPKRCQLGQGKRDNVECTHHLDFHESFIAIVEQIPCFAAVDSHDAQQQLAAQPERHWRLTLVNNRIHAAFDVRLKDVGFGELALDVGGKPNSSQGPGFGQQGLGVKHVDDPRWKSQ